MWQLLTDYSFPHFYEATLPCPRTMSYRILCLSKVDYLWIWTVARNHDPVSSRGPARLAGKLRLDRHCHTVEAGSRVRRNPDDINVHQTLGIFFKELRRLASAYNRPWTLYRATRVHPMLVWTSRFAQRLHQSDGPGPDLAFSSYRHRQFSIKGTPPSVAWTGGRLSCRCQHCMG
jgi:hypothetical protein